MIRAEVTKLVLSQKRMKGLSWKEIHEKVSVSTSPIVVTATLAGQMTLEPNGSAEYFINPLARSFREQ